MYCPMARFIGIVQLSNPQFFGVTPTSSTVTCYHMAVSSQLLLLNKKKLLYEITLDNSVAVVESVSKTGDVSLLHNKWNKEFYSRHNDLSQRENNLYW